MPFDATTLLSVELRIGSSTSYRMEEQTTQFHEKAVSEFHRTGITFQRVGLVSTTPLPQSVYVYEPQQIGALLAESLAKLSENESQMIDVLLVDITSATIVREPMLIALFEKLKDLAAKQICHRYILLLPSLPGRSKGVNTSGMAPDFDDGDSGSVVFLKRAIHNENLTISVIMAANSGDVMSIGTKNDALAPNLFNNDELVSTANLPSYRDLIRDSRESAEQRLQRRCVRRIGHFPRNVSVTGEASCRRYSYTIDGCDSQILELVESWWEKHNPRCKVILHDSKTNGPFRQALKAFAEQRGFICERVASAKEIESVTSSLVNSGLALLALDVVSTGETLQKHVDELRNRKIGVLPKVLTCINRGSSIVTEVRGMEVHGLIARPTDEIHQTCIQCELGLLHTPDEAEPFLQFRAFDFLQLTVEAGIADEPINEVPQGRKSYQALPAFSKLLEEDGHGGLIAYKLKLAIENLASRPVDWFIVHPDQADANTLSDLLIAAYDGRPSSIKFDKDIIEIGLRLSKGDRSRCNELATSLTGRALLQTPLQSALILDIFNATGSTRDAMLALLREFKRSCFAYSVVVDFAPEGHCDSQVKRISLYDWQNPRNELS